MKKIKKRVFFFGLGFLLLISTSFSQVELSVYCQYQINMSFPDDGTIHPDVAFASSFYPDAWKPFFGPVLQQHNGLGVGCRIAFFFTPSIGIESSFDYIMAKLRFPEEEVALLQDLLESSPLLPIFSIADSGGSIMRYYGNVVINLVSVGRVTSYLTAGLGITRFALKKGAGPEITSEISARDYRLHLHYDAESALTFNGGFGIKLYLPSDTGIRILSPHAGFRLDIRVFVCQPKFQQKYFYRTYGSVYFDDVNSYTQHGSQIDLSINLGYFIKF